MILMIYQKDTFREYVLPKINNADYPIVLDKNQFHIKENITLSLEVMENQWIIRSNMYYSMVHNSTKADELSVKNGDIIFFKTANNEKFQGIIVAGEESFKVYKKYDISRMDYISIGKDSSNLISYSFMDLISKNHGIIRREGGGFYLEDYSSNGIFVNYVKINGKTLLNFGDVINIFGLHIIFLGGIIGVNSNYGQIKIDSNYLVECKFNTEDDVQVETNDKERMRRKDYFNRSPRNISNIHLDEVEIEAPPEPKITPKKPLIYTIGPSFTMAIPMLLGCMLSIFGAKSRGGSTGAYMYTGIVTMIGSAVLGTFWALANLKYSKQQEKESEQLRFDSYGNYLLEKAEELKQKYQDNYNALYNMYPSASECSSYGRENVNLWNRNISHDDVFYHRLGLGDIPFQVNIKVPKEKFTLAKDSLKEKPLMLLKEYEILRNVPVGINISENRLWGIIGGKNISGAIQVMYNLVAQIAANNCYTDVKMAFVYNEKSYKDKENWMFAKWLPHVWSEDKKSRYVASNELEAKDVFFDLANIMRHRSEIDERKTIIKPHYVLFISESSLLEGDLLKKYIFTDEKKYGLTTFIMSESYEGLPNECENIIQYDNYFQGVYNTMNKEVNKQQIAFDSLDVYSLTAMAKRLSEIEVNEIESNGDIPNSLDFMEMYNVSGLKELQVIERWRKNRTFNTMKALVGKKAGGSDCYLDIHEKFHGPHGLVAGTTGSGKSEILQTYMLSLAINYSPDDIGFFIIDFKGGGMANLFSNLPHMSGQISNLSGNQIRRAMISIKSENMRRQRIFSEYGVNNINLYTRLYKNNETKIPVPHLFIIIDEFAELKREEPEFMKELISVAQVGRSLGVHLILATQKPSGTVDDNIWSNSKFRLCLRVQDKQDSNDMLHKPDAAFITQAGRCYMQVGNDEIYELFQSGWSGAVYDESAQDSMNEIATMLTLTGKTAIVGSHNKIKRKEEEKKKYYKAIVDIIISLMFSNSIFDLKNIDENKLETFIDEIIEEMNNQKLEYENSTSNVKRLKDMLELWPNESMESEKIVEYVMANALKKNVKLPEMKEKTQLDAIVEYLGKVAKDNAYDYRLQLWLPVLPEELYLKDIVKETELAFDGSVWNKRDEWNLEISVGMYDDPVNQAQENVEISFSEGGHLAICGSIVSGKSTLIQTILYSLTMKYSPEYISIYGLDFSSGLLKSFSEMPHVGGLIDENDTESIAKLFNMINSIMEDRKKVLGGGNYAQYVKAYGVKFPAIFIVVDNYSNFLEKTDSAYADIMLRIAREGVGYGIYLILSSAGFGMAEIPNRMADNIKNILCLEMGDKFKYMDVLHMTHIDVLPENDVKGRGLVNINGSLLEFQTALCVKAEDDYKRGQMIKELANVMSSVWKGKRARKIPYIPENPVLSGFNELEEVKEFHNSESNIPIAYVQADASVYNIDLSQTYCFSIAGKNKTGKTSLLKLIIEQISHKDGKMVIFENGSQELLKLSETYNTEYITGDKEIFDYFKGLTTEFVRRNKIKNGYLSQGMTGEEIYEKIKQEEPIYIFIADFSKFLNSIYKPQEGVGQMKGFMENIIAKGELHNIYFFAVINSEEFTTLNVYQVFKSFIEYKKGIHLGGNVAGQRVFQFQNISFQESSKTYKKGIGLVSVGEENEACKIIIPMHGR